MTPNEVMAASAALLNDSQQAVYTPAAQLPYFNIALDKLQELYQSNDEPVTYSDSAIITVPANVGVIGFKTNPALPLDLLEIQALWERQSGVYPWTMVVKKEFLPLYLEGTAISQFLIYAWENQEIHVLPANQANDLKLQYIKNMFTNITTDMLDLELNLLKSKTFLEFKTAALCAMFIGENQTRAQVLESEAQNSIDNSLIISSKNRQAIQTRRRPFRASYKLRTWGR